jgi:hypothetical protein
VYGRQELIYPEDKKIKDCLSWVDSGNFWRVFQMGNYLSVYLGAMHLFSFRFSGSDILWVISSNRNLEVTALSIHPMSNHKELPTWVVPEQDLCPVTILVTFFSASFFRFPSFFHNVEGIFADREQMSSHGSKVSTPFTSNRSFPQCFC